MNTPKYFVSRIMLLSLWVLPMMATAGGFAYIETHVYDKLTGVPLEGVVIHVEEIDAYGNATGNGMKGQTDQNGFYVSGHSTDQYLRISATCSQGDKSVTVSIRAPDINAVTYQIELHAAPPVFRRDAYLALINKTGKRGLTANHFKCDGLFPNQ